MLRYKLRQVGLKVPHANNAPTLYRMEGLQSEHFALIHATVLAGPSMALRPALIYTKIAWKHIKSKALPIRRNTMNGKQQKGNRRKTSG